MARIKRGLTAHKRKKKVLKMAKGYYGAKSKQFRSANQAVIKSMAFAYSGRKQKKRDYRRLWIVRINAAARLNGMSYSTFINGLKIAGIDINRKMLSELAIADMNAFAELVTASKKAIEKGPAEKAAPVKKAPAATVKVETAEKAPAKKPAAKATADKAETAEKAPAKKPATKATAAKAETAEKAPAKKPAAKATAAKAETAEKAPAKKPAAKKATEEK
jgi:large subunit ribosomal protein L20